MIRGLIAVDPALLPTRDEGDGLPTALLVAAALALGLAALASLVVVLRR